MRAITATLSAIAGGGMTPTTWNPADLTGITLSNGNLTATNPTGPNGGVRSIASITSGKYYWEVTVGTWSNASTGAGFGLASVALANLYNAPPGCFMIYKNGNIFNNGSQLAGLGAFVSGGSICFALDLTNKLAWARNGAAGNWNGSGTANPATGAGGVDISAWATAAIFAMGAGAGFGDVWTANFGASAFVGAVPSGFSSGFGASGGGTNPSPALIRMDNYATAVVGGQIVVSGGAAFTLFHSHDDPCDLVNPVPVGSMFWDNSLLPGAAAGGSASVSFQIMACPLYFQLNLTNATGSVRATFLQIGEHSHSNIAKGPFAPPKLASELDMPPGSNFAAMGA